MARTRLVALLLLLAMPPVASGQTSVGEEELTDRERATHLLSRLSFGPRPGDLEALLEEGIDAWLDRQLAPVESPYIEDLLSRFESLGMTSAEVYDTFDLPEEEGESREERRARERIRRKPREEMLQASCMRVVHSPNVLEEVMVDFWRNHFNVSYTKGGPANYLLTSWDREVLRSHALGKFGDMLAATAKHPAMLHYLDNSSSRRPPSKQELAEIERNTRRRTGSRAQGEAAVQLALQRGLNENYARELLELHTLGVDNYYKQKDVVALAEVLTGWTYSGGRNGTWEFVFRNNMHQPGDKKLLGKRIRTDKDNGVVEGDRVLEILSEHKGTADFIALKLCRALVSDEPPQDLLKKVAQVFKKSDGDIPKTIRAVVESKEFWSRDAYRAKFKTPWEFAMSALRITDSVTDDFSSVLRRLNEMSQPLYQCDDPTGWYDTAESWLDPGVMAFRWQFSLDLASGNLGGVSIPDEFWDAVPEHIPARLWQHHFTKLILPGGAGPRTRNALSSTTDSYLAETNLPEIRELGPQLVGLLLGSPEFQQQ